MAGEGEHGETGGALAHLDARGRPRMVDVSAKADTHREARARGWVSMAPATVRRLVEGGTAKGDAVAVAHVAGIMAAKETSRLIPLCHPLPLSGVDLSLTPLEERGRVEIEATVRTRGPTGVEMEALTAVAAAALTLYDMLKAVDKGMVIGDIRLVEKKGGRGGYYRRPDEPSGGRAPG